MSQTGTAKTGRISRGCTTVGQMDMLEKHKEWYDTRISVLHLLHTYLFITLHYVLQKSSPGVEPHYLEVWVPMHWDDDTSTQKLVSTNLYN
jgi:hypothetical protein